MKRVYYTIKYNWSSNRYYAEIAQSDGTKVDYNALEFKHESNAVKHVKTFIRDKKKKPIRLL